MAAAIAVDWRGSGNSGVNWFGGTMDRASLVAVVTFGGFGDYWGCFPFLVLWTGTAVSGASCWSTGGYRARCMVKRGGAFAGNGRSYSKAEGRVMKNEKNRAFLRKLG